MRKAAIVIGILVAVSIIACLVFWATFDINRYRGTIQSQLENRLGRPVVLGQMHLSLFPTRFQVDKFSIADDARFGNPKPFVQAEQFRVSVNLLPLLRSRLVVTSVSLSRPVVELSGTR